MTQPRLTSNRRRHKVSLAKGRASQRLIKLDRVLLLPKQVAHFLHIIRDLKNPSFLNDPADPGSSK